MKPRDIMFITSSIVGSLIVIIMGIKLNVEVSFYVFPICFVIGISFLISRIIMDSEKPNLREVKE